MVPWFCISWARYVVLAPGAAHTSSTVVLGLGSAASAAKQLALS